jgi:hypothetical protein
MAYQSSILAQVVKNVNRHDFQKQVSKLSCFNLLIAMIFTHPRTNRTIRDIVLGFEAAMNKLYRLGFSRAPKRSTISDSLAKRPAQIYGDYYRSV